MEPLRIEVQALNAQALSALRAVEMQAGATAAAATGLDASIVRLGATGAAALTPLNQSCYASATALNAMAAAEVEAATAARAATAAIVPLNQQIYQTTAAARVASASMAGMGGAAVVASRVITPAMAASSGGLLMASTSAVQATNAFSGLVKIAGGFLVFSTAINVFNSLKQSMTEAVTSTMALGKELDVVSSKTGISTSSLGALRYAADQSEVAFSSLAMGIRFLQINLVEAATDPTSEAAKAFKQLGVSALDAEGNIRKADEILPSIAQGMMNLANDADRTALSVQIFGRAGATLLPMFEGGVKGITDLTDKARELGVVLDPDLVAKAARLEDTVAGLSMRWQALKSEAVEPLLEPLNQVAEDLLILQKYSELMDAKAIESFNKRALYSFAPYPSLLDLIGVHIDSVHDKALEAAEAMRQMADEAANTSRIGELRLGEQSPYDVPREYKKPTMPKESDDLEGVQAAIDYMNKLFRRQREVQPGNEPIPGVEGPPRPGSTFGYYAGVRTGELVDADREARAERERLAAESAAEAEAFVLSLIPAAEKMKGVTEEANKQVAVMSALDSVFNDLGRVAEFAGNKTLALVASISSLALEMVKLFQSMSAGGGGGGGIGAGFLQLFSLFGSGKQSAGNAPLPGMEGPPSPKDLNIRASRLEVPAETFKSITESGNAILKASDKFSKSATVVAQSGEEMASAVATAGAPVTGASGLLGMAGYMAIGATAVMGIGRLLGGILSQRNQKAYDAYAELDRQLEAEKSRGGGPIVTRAMTTGLPRSGGGNYPVGYIGTIDDSPWHDPDTSPDPGPPGQRGGRAGSSEEITINVKSVDTKSAKEYFSSADFTQAMRWARSVRTS